MPGLGALAEPASFFGQLHGGAFPLVEALGIGPVGVGASYAIECGDRMPGTPLALAPSESTIVTRA